MAGPVQWIPSKRMFTLRPCIGSKTKKSTLQGHLQVCTNIVKIRHQGRTQEIGITSSFTGCLRSPSPTTKTSQSSQEAQGLLAAESKHHFQLSELTLISILRGPSGTCSKWAPCTWWVKTVDGSWYVLSRKRVSRTSSHWVKFSRVYLSSYGLTILYSSSILIEHS